MIALLGRLATGFTGLFSTKLLFGMVVGAFAVMAGFLWKAGHDRDVAQKQVTDIGKIVAQAEGLDAIEPGDIATRIQRIVTERTVVKEERNECRVVRDKQSAAIVTLRQQTLSLQAQSASQVRAVQAIIKTRDRWINTANALSRRTAALPTTQEIKETEDALDALYRDGF